jgi:hypothetical protein
MEEVSVEVKTINDNTPKSEEAFVKSISANFGVRERFIRSFFFAKTKMQKLAMIYEGVKNSSLSIKQFRYLVENINKVKLEDYTQNDKRIFKRIKDESDRA